MRTSGWTVLAIVAVAALVVFAGCDGDGTAAPPNGGGGGNGGGNGTGGFDATAYEGTWSGQWTNQTFATQGPITMTIDATPTGTQSGTADLQIDLGGNVFGQLSPNPINIQLAWDENGATGSVPGTQIGDISLSIGADGGIQVDVTNVPASAIESVSVNGTSDANSISLNYTINFTAGGPATGVINLTKQT